MLEKLRIRNVALIQNEEIEFGQGFNVLSGETGAGKSIIIGSLNFIMGDKANKTMIRSGETSCRVDAVFSDETILTRTLKTDGKGECRVNDEIVTLSTLKQVSAALINIHGQHDTATMLDPKNYLSIICRGDAPSPALNSYQAEYTKLQDFKKELNTFGGSEEERNRTLDLLQFQIKEIEDADIKEGEDEELTNRKTHMQSFEKIKLALGTALQSDPGDMIGKMNSAMGQVLHLDAKVEEFSGRGKNLQHELDSLISDITSHMEDLDFDEDEFARVDARLDKIKALKRKYGTTITDVLLFLDKTKAEYDRLSTAQEQINKLHSQIFAQETRVLEEGALLTKERGKVAESLRNALVSELAQLAMESSRLEIRLVPISPSPSGCDVVELWFSANAGEPLKPLHQVISGGELSRFMLALKAVQASAQAESNPTLIFDEIDTGIGGMVAGNIARKIEKIATANQVIVVTHLATIAKIAMSHFLIEKVVAGGKTNTEVRRIEGKERENELSRMEGRSL